MEVLLAVIVMSVAMLGMGIGVIVSNRRLSGSCGGPDVVLSNGEKLNCGACPKSEKELCPSDDLLVQLAQMAHPNPKEHH